MIDCLFQIFNLIFIEFELCVRFNLGIPVQKSIYQYPDNSIPSVLGELLQSISQFSIIYGSFAVPDPLVTPLLGLLNPTQID
jgi:hypothetical protein